MEAAEEEEEELQCRSADPGTPALKRLPNTITITLTATAVIRRPLFLIIPLVLPPALKRLLDRARTVLGVGVTGQSPRS